MEIWSERFLGLKRGATVVKLFVVVSVYKKSCLSCVSLFPGSSGCSEPVQGHGVYVMCGLCRHAWVVNAFDVQILIN